MTLSPFSLLILALPSPYFFASFLPPPNRFLAVSPFCLNRSSPLLKNPQSYLTPHSQCHHCCLYLYLLVLLGPL